MHKVDAKAILSPENGMNIYRGCTHGCIYCDSHSRCYHIDHAFTDVEVKQNAATLLDAALSKKRARCMVGTGSMCDPYQPVEEELRLMRRCAEVVERHGCGLTVITKSDRVLRDLDLFRSIQEKSKCVVQMTLTTFDEALCAELEPNVCNTQARASALLQFRDAGVPTVVWLSPILPFINDTKENLDGVLDLCFAAGVRGILCFGMGVTLREGSREYFYAELDRRFPGMKERYIRAFGTSYVCASPQNDALMARFASACEKRGVLCRPDEIFHYLSTFDAESAGTQMRLF